MAQPKKSKKTPAEKNAVQAKPLTTYDAFVKKQKSNQPQEAGQTKVRQRVETKSDTEIARHPVTSASHLFIGAIQVLWRHWQVFTGILATYAVLMSVFVGGFSSSSASSLKSSFNQAFHGHFKVFSTGVSLFSVIVGADNKGATTSAGAYEMILFVTVSLALIWTLRQVYAKHKVGVRDGFYMGMYPLVPFLIILFLIGLELIPLVVGGAIYGDVVGGGITVNMYENVAMFCVFILFAAATVYMLCSTIFALYIATLPDATPMQALRSARELVRYRRWVVLRKVLFLPLALFIGGTIIIIPIALFVTPIATPTFFLLSIIALAIAHSYLYALYRELL
jgi:hypothetical protein